MKNTPKTAGNAFVIVLILIALLAALTITLTRMGSTTQNVSEEQASVLADQILRYSANVQAGIQNLIARGCSADEIRFERPPFDGTDTIYRRTANTRSDKSCYVFDQNGAGLAYSTPPAAAFKGTAGMTSTKTGVYYFSGFDCMPKLGDVNEGNCPFANDNTDTDLILFVADLNDAVCDAINKKMKETKRNWSSSNNNWYNQGAGFKGIFGTSNLSGSSPKPDNNQAVCYYDQHSPGFNALAYVLMIR